MYISKEIDYALRSMMALAKTPDGLSEKDITHNYKIPHGFLALLLPKLLRAKLITLQNSDKSKIYKITPHAEINLLQVVEAINGKINLHSINPLHREDAKIFPELAELWQDVTLLVEKHLAGKVLRPT